MYSVYTENVMNY